MILYGLLALLLSAAGQGQAEREATARAQAIAVSGGPEALTAEIAAELADLGRFEDRVLEGKFGPALKNFPREAAAAFTQQDYEIQLNLLTYSWDRFAFAAMEPVLAALYRSPPDDSARVRDMALRRLYQLNPATARPLMLQELQRGDLRVSMTTLQLLPDAAFPDFEEAWTRALEHGVLDERIDAAVRIERFGSASILPAVSRIYTAQAPAWSCDVRVAALAYLAKHDRAAAPPLIVDARMSCLDEIQAHPVLKQPPVDFEEEIIVTAARTGGRIDDQPTRVEVLDREEIEEKMMMTPGDIVMMLNEMGGLRVQSTSPSVGAASVRIQGMDGRYTRVLFDGLPLAGQQVGGLGLLQVPPMDLAQVEVIKGVASASYGAGALGGVINLVARRPTEPVVEALLNQSTIGATDGVVFAARHLTDVFDATLLAGAHYQARNDVDDDEWIDVAGYTRGVFRPRVFWSDDRGNSGSATAGVTLESRQGGPAAGSALESRIGGPESIDTTRADAGLVVNRIIRDRYFMTARLAATYQRHDHLLYVVRERDRHTNVFGEVALRGAAGRHTWVGGVAYERESLNPLDVPQFEYFHRAPGVFGQDDFQWFDWLTLSAGARLDVHHTYGNQISPRVAALARWNGWTSRLAAGGGFFASTPLTEETEAAGLSRLSMPAPLRKETGRSFSIDVTRAIGDVTITGTFFASTVSDPVHVERDAAYVIGNATGPTTHRGVEMLGTYRRAPYALTANYTFVRAREDLNGARVESALTPAHALSLVGMWEREGWGRVGIEYYFTGAQRLEGNPFRDRSEPYSVIGVLAERAFDRFRVFVNLENLTGVRQTNYDPLVKPAPAADGRWSVDGWAPLDGRTLNAGLRVTF